MFRHTLLSKDDKFASCILGNRYKFDKVNLTYINQVLTRMKNYSDNAFKGYSRIFDRVEIERAEMECRAE